jgi:hypothetical protein
MPVFVRRLGIVVALTFVAIELHELGHFAMYHMLGYSARMSLQRTIPALDVPPHVDLIAKLAGPLASLLAAALLTVVARRVSSFAWSTAAFTNATLRLLPLAMDVQRSLRGKPAFSDEGEVARALSASVAGQLGVLALFVVVSVVLSVLAARTYRFARHRTAKIAGIFLTTMVVGICVVIADELLGWDKLPPPAAAPGRSPRG